MAIIHAKEENFNEIISKDLVLVDFFANWCGPCKMLSPILENLASSREEIKIVKVDVDECPALARTYGVMSIPTLLIFKNGKLLESRTGFMPESEINNWLQNLK